MLEIGRRRLLAAVAGAAAGLGGTSAATAAQRRWPLGVQLYSVNAELDRDFDATLHRLSALGFQACEAAGLHGRTPEAFRRSIAAAGLVCDSAHLSMPDLAADPASAVSTVRDMGVRWLVCSSPQPDRPPAPGQAWIPGLRAAMTLDAWKANADRLNRADQAARAGLRTAYHNHPFEFARYDGRRGFDVLLERTDPERVRFELDVAWAVAGGADPVALLRAHPGRFVFLHLKGLAHRPTGDDSRDEVTTEVGHDDVIDWPAVLAAAVAAGVQGGFVEQEPPYRRPVFESLALCRDALDRLWSRA